MRTVPLAIAAVTLIVSAGLSTVAKACAIGAAIQAAPAQSSLPAVEVWFGGEIARHVEVPDCLGWPTEELTIVVEARARFAAPGGWPVLLRRLGAISAQRDIRYWSASRGRWRDLLDDAGALAADAATVRPDFDPVAVAEYGCGTCRASCIIATGADNPRERHARLAHAVY